MTSCLAILPYYKRGDFAQARPLPRRHLALSPDTIDHAYVEYHLDTMNAPPSAEDHSVRP